VEELQARFNIPIPASTERCYRNYGMGRQTAVRAVGTVCASVSSKIAFDKKKNQIYIVGCKCIQ
jgi:hypothetical protein